MTRNEDNVKQDKNTLPMRLEAGGVCIQAHDWSELNVARIRFPKGADATPLLVGSIHVKYADGSEEVVRAGEVYYWPPGHTVWVDEDYEAVEFSPARPMGEVIDHLNAKLKA